MSESAEVPRTRRWLTSKGLGVKKIRDELYVVEDVFGHCLLPRRAADLEALRDVLRGDCNVELLCAESELSHQATPDSFGWDKLELHYVARLTDLFRYWQAGRRRVPEYDVCRNFVLQGYEEWGFGEGSKPALEQLDWLVRSEIAAGRFPLTADYLGVYLHHVQLRRICSDIMSLLHRSIRAFYDLLIVLRRIIRVEDLAREQLRVSETVHTGPESYQAASAATICAISLCTSLDLSSKLIHFVNRCARPAVRFRPAQGKHFSDLLNLRAATLPENLLAQLKVRATAIPSAAALIQMRHDLVHSTTALELERVFVGYQTGQVNDYPLHYSEIHWRDCGPDGQPERFLGRDYFTAQNIDMETQLYRWIRGVCEYHVDVGAQLLAFFETETIDDTGLVMSRLRPSEPAPPS